VKRRTSAARLAILWLTLALPGSSAHAASKPQCWDCVERLTMELPEVNPSEDPEYEKGLSPASVLPALSQCSLDDSEIPDLKRIIDIFTEALVDGGGTAYVKDHLASMPQLNAVDRAKLIDGAVQSLDSTLRHLIDHNCRILLKSLFDDGAGQAWILRMIQLGREYDATISDVKQR
jgi:hypothetical protein